MISLQFIRQDNKQPPVDSMMLYDVNVPDWLAVSNILYFPVHIWDVHIFQDGYINHQPAKTIPQRPHQHWIRKANSWCNRPAEHF
jgi:hypothetical protein